ncbi:DUF1289 domain-containing protein [Psychromarinibacter sp. C21-152]|uniref:DUF1289 domain-containing protein n=1 Tax=Psychromarinibacter sediminicola TaxID=3033385 RepID=A0AAE3NUU0_9RHOB|nr:DUF1289 domain-containing protein [Psychromarinibacter sediminicola]MDF0602517.1 DUF1289 domain-containing protein [Psychromarinibacter sediminicola]
MKDHGDTPGGIDSPCIRICVIHPEARICTGCLRTIEEITGWTAMSPEERRALMDELPERKGRLRKRRGGRRAKDARRTAS